MAYLVNKYFLYAFCDSGTKTAIPDATDSGGAVSFQQGWTAPYTYELGVNPNALWYPEPQENYLMYVITLGLKQYQQSGVPNFISTTDNGGTAYLYDAGAFAQYTPNPGSVAPSIYQSLVDGNNVLPGSDPTKWGIRDNTSQHTAFDAAIFVTGGSAVVNGDAVYFNTGVNKFDKAVANGAAPQRVVGFADVTNGRVLSFGSISLLSGLTPGAIYYLDPTTPGAITTVRPGNNAVQLGVAQTATLFLMTAPQILSSPKIVAAMYMSTNQVIGTGQPNPGDTLTYDTVITDPYSLCNTSAHTITVNQTGFWKFTASNIFTAIPTAGTALAVNLILSSAIVFVLGSIGVSATTDTINDLLNGTVILACTAGQVFNLAGVNTSSVTTATVNAGTATTQFSAEFLG